MAKANNTKNETSSKWNEKNGSKISISNRLFGQLRSRKKNPRLIFIELDLELEVIVIFFIFIPIFQLTINTLTGKNNSGKDKDYLGFIIWSKSLCGEGETLCIVIFHYKIDLHKLCNIIHKAHLRFYLKSYGQYCSIRLDGQDKGKVPANCFIIKHSIDTVGVVLFSLENYEHHFSYFLGLLRKR